MTAKVQTVSIRIVAVVVPLFFAYSLFGAFHWVSELPVPVLLPNVVSIFLVIPFELFSHLVRIF